MPGNFFLFNGGCNNVILVKGLGPTYSVGPHIKFIDLGGPF